MVVEVSFIVWTFFVSSVEMELIFFLVVLAAITRGAHIPFYTCLSAAMTTPTPVSPLLHSFDLVTADVC